MIELEKANARIAELEKQRGDSVLVPSNKLKDMQQRIKELEAIIEAAGKQRPYAFDSDSAGLSFENHYSDTKPLYTHPDYASAQRIKELEAEVIKWKEGCRKEFLSAIEWAGKHQEIHELKESLVSELSALKVATTWQPIETAPKDGSHFLGAEYWDGKWWYEEIWYSHTWGFGGGNFLSKPTHWMPLPNPPSDMGEK